MEAIVDAQNQTSIRETVSNVRSSTEKLNGILTELSKLTENPENRQNRNI